MMHILFLSPEVWPFIHVGGLSEVSHDLPLALGAMGHEVSVVTPKLRMDPAAEASLTKLDITLEVQVSYNVHRAEVYVMEMGPGVRAYLINHESLFDRDGLYGNPFGDYEDNAERFIFYSRASLELALALGWSVDIVHANDWTTGLVPLYLKTLYAAHQGLRGAASVMTVHNIGKQGVFWHYDMPLTGLGWECFTPELVEFYGKINFLKAGLITADMITTVSETYCKDILTPELGFGLEGVLNHRKQALTAITNGVDYTAWNPSADEYLVGGFDADSLDNRPLCAEDLRRVFQLEQTAQPRPVAAVLGSLSERKGVDLLAEQVDAIVEMGYDIVVMGYGDSHLHDQLLAAHERHRGRMGMVLGYEMALAHKIVAGADVVLMPSRYEPCGLHQLHGMRYGAVPVVRFTGGLADTVVDYDASVESTGFGFVDFSAGAMLGALQRAKQVHASPQRWRELMIRGMGQDFSWHRGAAKYEQVYHRAKQLREAVVGA